MQSRHMWRNWLLGISCLVSFGVTRVAVAQTNPPESPVPRDGVPPVVASSPDTTMVLPPPPVVVEPGYVQKMVVTPVAAPRWTGVRGPSFRPQFGLGGAIFTQGQMTWTNDDFTAQSGDMLQFLLRTTRFLTLEGSISWLNTVYNEQSTPWAWPPTSIPLRVGARVLPCALVCGSVQPYLVAALGVDYLKVNRFQEVSISWSSETNASISNRNDRLYFRAEGGAGLEVRFGKHVAVMADFRAVGEYTPPLKNVWLPSSISENSRFSILGGLSAAVYF